MEQTIQDDMYLAASAQVLQLLRTGKPDQDIVNHLLSRGIDNANAWALIARQKVAMQEHKVTRAKIRVGFGALWLLIGVLIIIASFSGTTAVGAYMATWMVTGGAIAFGVIQLLTGFGQLLSSVQRSVE